ncbi:MAG: hypothetical protein M3357_20025 [Actinomycetota bacterium]|nr:hypothetical protein [Actinomycetota bacterium]
MLTLRVVVAAFAVALAGTLSGLHSPFEQPSQGDPVPCLAAGGGAECFGAPPA